MEYITDWHSPTPQEIKAIHDPYDIPIISVIDGLPCKDRKLIYDSIEVKDEHKEEYNHRQLSWISDFKEYWSENHNNQDTTGCAEFGTDFINSKEFERFRLYYAAKHPERMNITGINKRTLDFFVEVEEAIEFGNSIIPLIKNN
jgi:hypothetical protein